MHPAAPRRQHQQALPDAIRLSLILLVGHWSSLRTEHPLQHCSLGTFLQLRRGRGSGGQCLDALRLLPLGEHLPSVVDHYDLTAGASELVAKASRQLPRLSHLIPARSSTSRVWFKTAFIGPSPFRSAACSGPLQAP